jgi:hypothetical protein
MENITTFKQLREKVKRKLNERGMTFIDLSFGIKRPYRNIHDVLSGISISRPVIKQISIFLDDPQLIADYENIIANIRNKSFKEV